MKKTEIYVPIANKKEAKQAKAVLKAMGEVFIDETYDISTNCLIFNRPTNDGWLFTYESCIEKEKEKYNLITLKQLIELLVLENYTVTSVYTEDSKVPYIQYVEPKKIAIRVENEREFAAILRFYGVEEKKEISSECYIYQDKINFNNLAWTKEVSIIEEQGYLLSMFDNFAKENNVELPLIKSEDGIWLFEDSINHVVALSKDNWEYRCVNSVLHEHHNAVMYQNKYKAFSTKQAALDWIEAQKPKSKILFQGDSVYCEVKADLVKMIASKDGRTFTVDKPEIEEILKAMEEINNG